MNLAESIFDIYKTKYRTAAIQNRAYAKDRHAKIVCDTVALYGKDLSKSIENFIAKETSLNENDVDFLVEMAGYTDHEESLIRKIYDAVLQKQIWSFTPAFKDMLLHHYVKRDKPALEGYLKHALEPSSPLHLSADQCKYLSKRILKSKLELAPLQAKYLLSVLSKVSIHREPQYIVYLKTIDYLGKFTHVAYQVFESKFNDLYGGTTTNYTYLSPETVVKVLNACSESTMRQRLAKRFLLPPFNTNKYIQRAISKKIPEVQKLLNFA